MSGPALVLLGLLLVMLVIRAAVGRGPEAPHPARRPE